MNYRYRQVKSLWERDIAKKTQAWTLKEQTYKQDILNLQNSTDAKILQNLERTVQQKQELLNQTIKLLGPEEIKTPSDLAHLLKGKSLKSLIDQHETETNQLSTQLEQVKAKLTREQEKAKTEFQTNLSLLNQKITSLEQQLLQLAKQKLAKQKQAHELVSQLEQEWKEKQEQWETQFQQQQDYSAQTLAQTKAEQAEELKKKQTKITQLEAWSQGQHNRIQELENQTSVLELKLETGQRELQQKEQDWVREKTEIQTSREKDLAEQKTLYETKVQGLEGQLATEKQTVAQLQDQVSSQQTNIANLTEQNQRATETNRTHAQRITQLEEYLRTSQQESQTKQTTINQLNQDKVNLQTQITQLTQSQTELNNQIFDLGEEVNEFRSNLSDITVRKNELEDSLNQANTDLARKRAVLAQLLTNREEELTQIIPASFTFQEFKTWLEADESRKQGLTWANFLTNWNVNLESWNNFAQASFDSSSGYYSGHNYKPYKEVFRTFAGGKTKQELTLIKEVLYD